MACACAKKLEVAQKLDFFTQICKISPLYLFNAIFPFLWYFWHNFMHTNFEQEKSACAKEITFRKSGIMLALPLLLLAFLPSLHQCTVKFVR